MVNIVVKSANLNPYLVDIAPRRVILTSGHMVTVGERVLNGDLPKHRNTDAVMGDFQSKVPAHVHAIVLGYVNTTLTLWDEGHWLVQWRHPEDGLHPAHQLALADVVIRLHEHQEALAPTTEATKQALLNQLTDALRQHDQKDTTS